MKTPSSTPPAHLQFEPNPWRTRVSNLWWEARLGISTRGVVDVQAGDAYHYSTMAYGTVRRILDALQLGPQDVFADIGCGKGRVLCCAARLPVQRVVGVDLAPEFVEQARENARRLRGRRAPVEVHQASAQAFDYRGVTACLMFNPFGPQTLDAVLSSLHRAREPGARPLRIAYANPVHEEVFQHHRWLLREAIWARVDDGVEHAVSFYRAVEA
ncbi:MAG: class I SAM-dependent methyltransferase [Rubrivivax sp.]|nr:class I SAM-dependent methyltransferase [Rubrivivax sp.]